MPILEDLPIEEKVRRGNVLVRTRPRDVEETLLQLINDDDQVVAAAAIDVVRRRGMWTLADDLEHVLAHRDARDWYVFEAASRGRWPSSGCRRSAAASSGTSRCRRPRSPIGCAGFRSSRRSAWTNCTG